MGKIGIDTLPSLLVLLLLHAQTEVPGGKHTQMLIHTHNSRRAVVACAAGMVKTGWQQRAIGSYSMYSHFSYAWRSCSHFQGK